MGARELDSGDRNGPFPAEWGTPPGSRWSEARARWIAARVREHMGLTAARRRAREIARAGVESVRRYQRLIAARRDAA
jgi:hypothetical protein